MRKHKEKRYALEDGVTKAHRLIDNLSGETLFDRSFDVTLWYISRFLRKREIQSRRRAMRFDRLSPIRRAMANYCFWRHNAWLMQLPDLDHPKEFGSFKMRNYKNWQI